MHEEVAAAVGKNRTTITNALRLLKLDSRVKELLIHKKISEGHGKILAGLPIAQQYALAEQCMQKNWSVRKTELEAKKLQEKPAEQGIYSDPNLAHLESSLSQHLGNQVNIDYENRGGGYVKIRFNNIDELEGHFQKLGFKPENC